MRRDLTEDVVQPAPFDEDLIDRNRFLAQDRGDVCDDLLMACQLSAACPVYVAPAMDLEMYGNSATQLNLEHLRQRGIRVIGPESGELASGLVGPGRMTEPADIRPGCLSSA